MKHTLCLVVVVALLSSLAGAAWQRSPEPGQLATRLAIASVEGVKIESSQNIGRVSALISESVSEEAALPRGRSEAVINLGHQAIIERISMSNSGGEGRVAVSSSTDNGSWVSLGQTVFSSADSQVLVPFASVQGKFVKVEFELAREGGVRNFEIFGSLVAGSKDKLRGKVSNMAGSISGARVIYVNPTPATGGDEAVRYGSFSFPESDDKYRTVIYDLGRPKVLNEFGSVHSPRPVRFEVFAFSELPEKEDWKGRRSFDPAVFEQTEPVASVEDKEGKGYVKCKPEQSVTAQFIALRWEPDFNPPAFTVSGVNIIGQPQDIGSQPSGAGGGQAGGNGGSDSSDQPKSEVVANPTAQSGFSGPFAPTSLMGAGSGGLPAVPQNDDTPSQPPTQPVVVPPVSPAP
jgi:hypothetical protein